jgi:hypothetical protein
MRTTPSFGEKFHGAAPELTMRSILAPQVGGQLHTDRGALCLHTRTRRRLGPPAPRVPPRLPRSGCPGGPDGAARAWAPPALLARPAAPSAPGAAARRRPPPPGPRPQPPPGREPGDSQGSAWRRGRSRPRRLGRGRGGRRPPPTPTCTPPPLTPTRLGAPARAGRTHHLPTRLGQRCAGDLGHGSCSGRGDEGVGRLS